MVTVEDCILGNSALHDRFFATTEILARLVSSAPRAVSLAQLEAATGRPEKELVRLCAALSRDGLLRQDAQAQDKWTLTCDPSLVTLEDVFRCVMSEQQTRSRKTADRTPNDVDLLVMQAMIAINQSVFKQLRQFSLDRLKISAAGMFPSPRRALRDPGLEDGYDFAISGREASFSPVQVPA
ncbi:Rrf2 family transcriptional regulator [Noviherbaspirillum sp. ST9]|uniref:Rrf2 family transcriptional regulator n=1 Tax=Noviherbaspirillum sp. ST9 TaxID=3401606 RepID=UPI003B588F6B